MNLEYSNSTLKVSQNMTPKSQQIAKMIDMLPEQDQELAFELVLAWDPNFTKLTTAEEKNLDEAKQEKSL